MNHEEKRVEVLIDFFNAIESAAFNAKRQIADAMGLEPPTGVGGQKQSYDPEKILWVDATGANGAYQKAVADKTSQPPDFVGLLEDLKAHNGKLQRNGLFYWVFDKGPTAIGRKPSKK